MKLPSRNQIDSLTRTMDGKKGLLRIGFVGLFIFSILQFSTIEERKLRLNAFQDCVSSSVFNGSTYALNRDIKNDRDRCSLIFYGR